MEEIFLRIALCDTDQKFEDIIQKYLVEVIEGLQTNQAKALEIITHVKKRVSSRSEVQLPLNTLFNLYETTNFQPCKTFALLFIKLGITRIRCPSVLDVLVKCIQLGVKAPIFCSLFTQNLHYLIGDQTKKEDLISTVKSFLSHAKYSYGSECSWFNTLIEHFIAVICYSGNNSPCITPTQIKTLEGARLNQLTRKNDLTEEEIQRERKQIAIFVIHWSYMDKLNPFRPPINVIFKLLNVVNNCFSGFAELALRQLDYDFEDESLVTSVYKFYLGELGMKDKQHRHQMAPLRVRCCLVQNFLLKSNTAAGKFPQSLQVTFDLLSDGSNVKTKKAETLGFDWLDHLKAHTQIRPTTVHLMLNRFLDILDSEEPVNSERVMSFLPHLLELNKIPFQVKFDRVLDHLLSNLRLSPAATHSLLTLTKAQTGSVDNVMKRITAELMNPPNNDKWFSIGLIKCINELNPFDPDLGPHRVPILNAVCNKNFTQQHRQEALKMCGLINFQAFINHLRHNELSVTYELITLIKYLFMSPETPDPNCAFNIDAESWHKNAIPLFKKTANEDVKALQRILLQFPSIGETTSASETVQSQLEMLDATIRAGHLIDQNNIFIRNSVGTVRPTLISHYLQGHTQQINYCTASLLASQMIVSSYDEYSDLFQENTDLNQETAYNMVLALYCKRMPGCGASLMVAIQLLQNIITSAGWESSSVVILERLLTTLGDLSNRIEVEEDLIDRVKNLINHAHEKVKVAAIKCVAKIAGSPHHQTSWKPLMELIFSIESSDTSSFQLSIGEAVTALAIGRAPAEKFDEEIVDAVLRKEIIDEVLKRTFGASKAKSKGTGIWLAGLVQHGKLTDPQVEIEIYYGLVNRMFLSPDESPFAAKVLNILFLKMSATTQKLALDDIQKIIKNNKAPGRDGKPTEKTLMEKETSGLKELVRIVQDAGCDSHVFDLLSISSSTSAGIAAGVIPEMVVNKLVPALFIMYHHPHDTIRATAKIVVSRLNVLRRVEQNIISIMTHIINCLNGFDGDYREAAARALPKLLCHIQLGNSSEIEMIELWKITMKACDDTRTNVRNAASVAANELCDLTVRIVSQTGSAPAWIEDLISIIVHEYLECPSLPLFMAAMNILAKWTKSEAALPLLFKHAPKIVPSIIQKSAISEQVNVTKGKTRSLDYASIEKDTMEESKSSFFISTVLRIMENDKFPLKLLEETCPTIGQLIKRGLGINARAMAIYVAGRVSLKWGSLLSNTVGKMMAPMMPLLSDSSESLRNETASAMPFLLNISSDKTKQNFLDRAEKIYFDARKTEDPNVIGRVLLKSVNKFNSDHLPFIAPLVWIGQFDPVDGKHFKSIWNDGLFNIKHIGKEIVELSCTGVESSGWSLRTQSLSALEEVASSGKLDPIYIKYYLKILSTKYFNGKEAVVRATTRLACQEDDEERRVNVLNVLLNESQNGSPNYKKLVIGEIYEFIQCFTFTNKTASKDSISKFYEENNISGSEPANLKTTLEKWL